MLHLDQVKNRVLFMTITSMATAALLAATVQGINAVGIILASAVINIVIYFALPDSYSKAYMIKHPNRYLYHKRKQSGITTGA